MIPVRNRLRPQSPPVSAVPALMAVVVQPAHSLALPAVDDAMVTSVRHRVRMVCSCRRAIRHIPAAVASGVRRVPGGLRKRGVAIATGGRSRPTICVRHVSQLQGSRPGLWSASVQGATAFVVTVVMAVTVVTVVPAVVYGMVVVAILTLTVVMAAIIVMIVMAAMIVMIVMIFMIAMVITAAIISCLHSDSPLRLSCLPVGER